jgi:hypothetical protein
MQRALFSALGKCADSSLDSPKVANQRLRAIGEYSQKSAVIDTLQKHVPDECLVECDAKLQDLIFELRKDTPDAARIRDVYQQFRDSASVIRTPSAATYSTDKVNNALAEFHQASDAGRQSVCEEIAEQVAEHLPVVLEKRHGKMCLSLVESGGARTLLASSEQCVQLYMDHDGLCIEDAFNKEVVSRDCLSEGRMSGVLEGDHQSQVTCAKMQQLLKECAVGMSGSYSSTCGKPTANLDDGVGKITIDTLEYDLARMFKYDKQGLLDALSKATQVTAHPGAAVLVEDRWIPAQLWVQPTAEFNLGARDNAISALKDLVVPETAKMQHYKDSLDRLSDLRAQVGLATGAEHQRNKEASKEAAGRCAAMVQLERDIQHAIDQALIKGLGRS